MMFDLYDTHLNHVLSKNNVAACKIMLISFYYSPFSFHQYQSSKKQSKYYLLIRMYLFVLRTSALFKTNYTAKSEKMTENSLITLLEDVTLIDITTSFLITFDLYDDTF